MLNHFTDLYSIIMFSLCRKVPDVRGRQQPVLHWQSTRCTESDWQSRGVACHDAELAGRALHDNHSSAASFNIR